MENYEFDNLLYAAASGDLEGIAKWIKEGAGVNNQDDRGYTPLMLAARMGRTDSVTLLLENGADPGIRDNLGKTAARIAMEAGFEDISGKIEKAAGEKSDFEIPEVVKETAIETFVIFLMPLPCFVLPVSFLLVFHRFFPLPACEVPSGAFSCPSSLLCRKPLLLLYCVKKAKGHLSLWP